ncbi:hypothetical protein BGZ96_002642 [Linnemannia gamsii]|uniref:F-box domain-containing protein n=1 Tax=Linnemannia gamsii TaxID=64522 RepID=A0ABQ7JKJ2_9FUNG|nr:hypothetical protein BGZ96_002642 [Linnemannia gamsii]
MYRQPQKAHPLEMPTILELIGANLDDDDDLPSLKACSLLSHEWHRHFAPFLWWRVIDNLDKVLIRLYKTKFAPSLPNVDPAAHLEPEFLALINTFVAKIDDPTIPMAIHQARRTVIRTPSIMSFVILGYLCKPIREINFAFHSPPVFSIYDSSVKLMVAPENCRMSDDYWKTEQRIENILTVLENSPSLEVLTFCDDAIYPLDIPHQWRQLSLPMTVPWSLTGSPAATSEEPPRWPKLHNALLERTKVDRHYLEIFLFNTPRLRTLKLRHLEIFNIRGNLMNRNILPDPTTLAQRNRDFCSLEDSTHPYTGLEELSMISLQGISLNQQLEFALGLPDLRWFTFMMHPYQSSDQLYFHHGFGNLTAMALTGDFNHDVLIRAASRLKYLHLAGSSFMDDDLFNAICRLSDTLETVIIHSRGEILRGGTGPHLILRTCRHLLEFKLHLPTFDCNPDQAQASLFKQIASTLPELRNLSFGGGTGSFDFNPHEGLTLLTPLKKLEVLNLRSKSLEANAPLTVEHAKLFVSEWPALQAIEGLYHYDIREFLDYVQENRPEVDFNRF